MELNRDTHGHCSVRWSIFQVQYCQMELADGVTGWAFTCLVFTGSFTGLATLQRSDFHGLEMDHGQSEEISSRHKYPKPLSHRSYAHVCHDSSTTHPKRQNRQTAAQRNSTRRTRAPPSQTHCMLAVPEEDTVELPTVLCCTDRPHGQSGRKGGSATV